MASAAILNCYFVTVDHTRSLLHGPNFVLKFDVNHITTFRDMDILKILQIWLKTPIRTHKFTFWGVLTPKHYFS